MFIVYPKYKICIEINTKLIREPNSIMLIRDEVTDNDFIN